MNDEDQAAMRDKKVRLGYVVWSWVLAFAGPIVMVAPATGQPLPTLPPAASEPPATPSPAEELPAEALPTEALPAESPAPESPAPASEEEAVPESPSASDAVELNLPDLVNIVIQGNRELKNAVLERVVQQQTLTEAESVFSPRFTPSVSVQAERTLLESDSVTDFADVDDSDRFDNLDSFDGGERTTLSENIELSSTLRTPIGTELEVSLKPVDEDARVGITVRQPLLRGAGQAVNRAPVQQARIAESNNVLDLQQQVIDTITTSITQYTTLIQSQEAVAIQAQALERRQQQFEIVNALVEAGRRARIDLIDSERSIAEAELGLQNTINQLSQANTDLLNLIGAEKIVQFVVPDNAIEQLFESATLRVSNFQLDELITLAYDIRTDYKKAQSQVEINDLDLLLARDNRRWGLDWRSTARVGDDLSQVATGLELRRTFGDENLNTAVQRSQTSILQQQNTLAQLTETIRNEITDRLRDVNSGLAQVESAQRATEATDLQLQVTKEKFKLGRDGATLFDITQQEENLVNAQNEELRSRIDVLNSIAELEKAVGITLETWEPLVDLSSVLAEDAVLTEETEED
ncbi:MAG: TolC family protein [Cyanobacteria bacterium P01_A01_bin.116]